MRSVQIISQDTRKIHYFFICDFNNGGFLDIEKKFYDGMAKKKMK